MANFDLHETQIAVAFRDYNRMYLVSRLFPFSVSSRFHVAR